MSSEGYTVRGSLAGAAAIATEMEMLSRSKAAVDPPDWTPRPNHFLSAAHAAAAEMFEAAGAKNVQKARRLSVPGFCIREIGTARIGHNRATSVVYRSCQAHNMPNIFVTDEACWVSSGCQHPTITMTAIAVRASDYITHEYAK